MLKDRAQKATALRFCISKRWLPQLEVEIEPSNRMEKSKYLLTDLDVLAIATSPVGEQTKFVFDCKSGARESAIGRAFWLHGVMAKIGSSHGFVVMNPKVKLSRDHRLSASELGVSLLHEGEFEDLALGLSGTTNITREYSIASDIDVWEKFIEIDSKYPQLSDYLVFSTSYFWTIKDAGEQCRKSVAKLRSIRSELDPSKDEHLAIFGDSLCLFLLAVSNLANRLFLILMRPTSKDEFSSLLLAFLYGGYESLQAALKIRKLATGAGAEDTVSIFPDSDRFEQLVREVVQAPLQALPAALLAREMAFCCLENVESTALQIDISRESPYATKFLLLAAEYLQKATKLPPEFSTKYADGAFKLMTSTLQAK
jgi:hypothetical protein